MQEENRYNDPLDDFSLLVCGKMSGHRLPVPPEDWEVLERKWQQRQRVRKHWWKVAGSVAAAGLIGLVATMFRQVPLPVYELADQGMEQIEVEEEKIFPETIARLQADVIRPEQKGKREEESIEATPAPPAGDPGEREKEAKKEVAVTVMEEEQVTEERVIVEERSVGPGNAQEFYPAVPSQQVSKRKKSWRSGWQLGAVIASGSNLNFSSGVDYMYGSDNEQTDPGPGGNPEEPEPEEPETRAGPVTKPAGSIGEAAGNYATDTEYSLPVTFGFTFRKELNDYIGIESGLVYTYLSTKYTRRGSQHFDAKATMHYIGVPVNLVVTLWKQPNWNIYFSAGIMGEKGVRMLYQEIAYGKQLNSETKVRGRIDGLQWSANFSPGLTYRITKEWGIYAEPRISYYFDNAQPENIRTEKPLVIGIGGGVRYHF
ncbi:MAG: porin family protein [Tannerellaceae bacterium]|nr:porin family protein [Tannerellaceae bacterium]